MADDAIQDRRLKPRRPAVMRVWADPGGVLPVIDCQVIDISDTGAKVAAVKDIVLPDQFILQVNASRILGEAHVVRRTEHFVGVEFRKS